MTTQLDSKINYLQKKKLTQIKNHIEFIKNKPILKIQQIFKNERNNVFPEEINKIAFSSNNDKRMQSIDSIETYVYNNQRFSK